MFIDMIRELPKVSISATVRLCIIAAIGFLVLVTSAASAIAAVPPVPGAIEADRHEETVTTTTSEVNATLKLQIRHFERTKKVLVAINKRPNGVKSLDGCINPVRKGWIKVGQKYTNSRKGGSDFTDKWQKKRKICDPKRVKKGKRWFMVGRKDNCDNRIKIQIKGPRKFKKYRKVVEFQTEAQFRAVYTEQIRSTTTTKVTYTCRPGYTLNGTWCFPPASKDSTQTPQPPAEAPGPNPQPSPQDPHPGGWQCFDEVTTEPVPPRSDGTCPPGSTGGPAV